MDNCDGQALGRGALGSNLEAEGALIGVRTPEHIVTTTDGKLLSSIAQIHLDHASPHV